MEVNTETAAVERNVIARVVSARMDKSASVEITRMVRHPDYGKYVRRRTKLIIHDEANECRPGDRVRIASCRPISRRKSWRLVEIVERAASEPGSETAEPAAGSAP
ncbi:MAG: 30S ribosomal protein S17 [Gammaproteobacteria bacterium]